MDIGDAGAQSRVARKSRFRIGLNPIRCDHGASFPSSRFQVGIPDRRSSLRDRKGFVKNI
jgi:hypothetical protein